jgi:hypothetical protein
MFGLRHRHVVHRPALQACDDSQQRLECRLSRLRVSIPKCRDDFVLSTAQKVIRLKVGLARAIAMGAGIVCHNQASIEEGNTMNVETTIVQVEQVKLTDRAPQQPHHEDSELRPLAYETLGMVGGGSSIVLL